ncbi:MAG: tryptophan--tRNA ligase [Planctomycetes bacterium]|nr:tryptophan--tRNA ligase [Planctomycetota bacterium]
MSKRILSGIQPSGQLHLGNYCGAIRQFLDLQAEGHELFVFVASYHALTTQRDPLALRAACRQIVVDYLAFGLDPARTHIYVQHDVPEVTELAWLLSCVCPTSLMDKAVSYKDKLAKGFSANVGLYTYPILQAADILAPRAQVVPVGKDQVQHIEITRDIAGRFNHEFNAEVFVLPDHRLAPHAEVLPGIDGEKMSKSYGNTIDPFQEEKALRKRIMSIKTDSKGVQEAKDPETCAVFRIVRALAGPGDARTVELAARYRDPSLQPGGLGFGYGHAKQALFELILDVFREPRARRAALMADPGHIEAVLKAGAAVARAEAARTVAAARAATGL